MKDAFQDVLLLPPNAGPSYICAYCVPQMAHPWTVTAWAWAVRCLWSTADLRSRARHLDVMGSNRPTLWPLPHSIGGQIQGHASFDREVALTIVRTFSPLARATQPAYGRDGASRRPQTCWHIWGALNLVSNLANLPVLPPVLMLPSPPNAGEPNLDAIPHMDKAYGSAWDDACTG